MTLAQLLAPIAAATIVNALLAGMAWRATQAERRTGQAPWYLGAGIVTYGAAAAAFLYAYRGKVIATPLAVFATSAVAEVFGAIAVYTLLHGIYRTDRITRGQRGMQIAVSIGLLGIVFAGLFA